jgi:dihydroorotate dehydrogenase electron transfer subunit
MYSAKIVKVVRLLNNVSEIHFNVNVNSYPGQFVMVNVPGLEEIPLSLSSPSSVTVKAVGETTEALVSSSEGATVGIRGAFGNAFSPSSKALIVAGGIGIAPMAYLYSYLVKCGAEVKVIFGEKSKENLFWTDRFQNLVVTTEDGSYGISGTVIDALKKEKLEDYERIYVCGSEPMLKAVHAFLKKHENLNKAEFSLERFMRCGIGVCGSCVIENGLRVCADGPVFKASELPW